jgi:SNF2 family DNA or RNA helicase
MERLTPLPHQERMIDWCLSRKSGYIQGGTGVGKTGVLWTVAEALRSAFGGLVLVLVPNSILTQFAEDSKHWLTGIERPLVLEGCVKINDRAAFFRDPDMGCIVLLSHESLQFKAVADALKQLKFTAVLVDEATRFRHGNTNRTRALLAISKRAKRFFLASGTPVVKNPLDIWLPMKMIDPKWCGITNKDLFVQEFCVTEEGYGGRPIPVDVRPEKKALLDSLLDRHRITCRLSDVRELPERLVSVRRVELSAEQRKVYNELKDTLALELKRTTDEAFNLEVQTYVARMLRLTEIAAGFARNIDGEVAYLKSSKTDELVELLQDPTPTIVWTWWRPEQLLVGSALTKAGIPWTNDPQEFHHGRGQVLLMQMAKGGFGLNILRAERMVYHSLCWDLETFLQSMERNNRLNTEHERLYVVHLIAAGTIDEKIHARLTDKAKMAGKLSRVDALSLLQ